MLPPRSRERPAARSAAEAPGWIALNGALALAFGLAAAFFPGPTAIAFVFVLAACSLATGLIELASMLAGGQVGRRLRLAAGYVALAVIVLQWPTEAACALVLWLALLQLAAAARTLASAVDTIRDRRPLVVDGLLRAVLGALLLLHPLAGVVAVTLWAGIAAFSYGLRVTLDSSGRLATP